MHPSVHRLAARLALSSSASAALLRGKISRLIARYSAAPKLWASPGPYPAIQRALLAAALRQLSARRRSSCASTAVFADMRSSVACHGHEMADNKKNMTPE